MQDEFYYSWDDFMGAVFSSTPFWRVPSAPKKGNLRFLEVVCLGAPDDDLTVSEVICARFSDEEIKELGLGE